MGAGAARPTARPLHVGPGRRQPEGADPVACATRSLSAYLGSSLFYRDALNALYGFGGVYASGVLGWAITQIGMFGIVGAVTGDGRSLDRRAGGQALRAEAGDRGLSSSC